MLILLVSFVVLFWTSGRSLLLRRFPTTTCLFVAWCALSCLWSVAPAQSAQFAVLSLALTLVSIAVAVALPLTELVGALILAFQWIIGSSFILEALVAFFGRGPLAPPIMWGRGAPAGVLLLGGRIAPGRWADPGVPWEQESSCFHRTASGGVLSSSIHADEELSALDAGVARLVRRSVAADAVCDGRSLDGRLLPGHSGPRRAAQSSGTPALARCRWVCGDRRSHAIAAFFCRHMIADAFGRSPDMRRALRHLARGGAPRRAAPDRRLGLVHWVAHVDGTFCIARDPS